MSRTAQREGLEQPRCSHHSMSDGFLSVRKRERSQSENGLGEDVMLHLAGAAIDRDLAVV